MRVNCLYMETLMVYQPRFQRKIPLEMKVATQYKLLSAYATYTMFIQFQIKRAMLPIHIRGRPYIT